MDIARLKVPHDSAQQLLRVNSHGGAAGCAQPAFFSSCRPLACMMQPCLPQQHPPQGLLLSAPVRGQQTEIAVIFAIYDCDAHRGPQKVRSDFRDPEEAMLHCDLRLRWKVASDLRFRAAITEPKTLSFCGISGDLPPSTQKSLAIAIVRFWCAKVRGQQLQVKQISDATSESCLCCRASACHSGKGTIDVASGAPKDEGRSCRCRPFGVSYSLDV